MAEKYRGIEIEITTSANPENRWFAQAKFILPGRESEEAKPPGGGYASESEAYRAALEAAVESIDRSRVSQGKW